MAFKVLIFIFALSLCQFYAHCAPPAAPPPPQTTDSEPPPTPTQQKVQLVAQPQLITVERFEELLKSAAEIFQPSGFQLVEILSTATINSGEESTATAAATATPTLAPPTSPPAAERKDDLVPVPLERMLPPSPQAYNFYLPLFDYAEQKSADAKSQSLGRFGPPPPPAVARSHRAPTPIYYAEIKPKKKNPKKFDNAAKQVNLKWLNLHEKTPAPTAASSAAAAGGGDGDVPTTVAVVPQTVYIINDERNRINFDDTFFGVDMQVKVPDNDPHKARVAAGGNRQGVVEGGEGFFNQAEELEDDLVATAARQMAQYA